MKVESTAEEMRIGVLTPTLDRRFEAVVINETVPPRPARARTLVVGCTYSVQPSEQGIRTWLRTRTTPIPAKQSGTLGT